MCRGKQVFESLRNSNIPAAGFIDVALRDGHEVIPTVWAAASPSAHVVREVFEQICNEIVEGLRAAMPLDGVYLDLHGAMVAEHVDDGEGELLRRVRALIGPNVPLVASLDLHGNTTDLMLTHADALVAYRTYPHVDMDQTGRRSYAFMKQRFEGRGRQHMHARRLPFLITTCWQSTDMSPARELYADLETFEQTHGVSSMSFNMGFPAADFEECGPVLWGYADTPQQAALAVDTFYERILSVASAFAGKFYTPDEAVQHAVNVSDQSIYPVVIADAQDNPGAGANSDTTGILRALLRYEVQGAALGLIVDPESAAKACAAGVGQVVRLSLGGKSGVADDAPLEADFMVECVSDGALHATGKYYRGFHMRLGPSACVRIDGVRIALASRKAQMADREMFRYVGIDPSKQRILVVKSTAHFRADFSPIAHEILVCLAPGSMPMHTTDLPWTRLPAALRMYPGGPTFAEWRDAQAISV